MEGNRHSRPGHGPGWKAQVLAAWLVVALVAVGVAALVARGPRGASAAALPPGWSRSPNGILTWQSPDAIPIFDARIDVHVGGRVVTGATVSPDRHRVSVAVPGLDITDSSSLAVVAAGRRLDAPGMTERSAVNRAAADPPRADPRTPLPDADDPGRPGPYDTRQGEYQLDDLKVPNYATPVEMRAVVVAPVGAPGPRPVALFLHGQHATCYTSGTAEDLSPTGAWPCPTGWQSVPSYRGYLTQQELLATQGWLTLSISANGINAQVTAELLDGGAAGRSTLIRAHLSRLAGWAASDNVWSGAPPALAAGPRADLSQVLLVGHSRGGEGAHRAALDSTTGPAVPWQIRAQVLIEPTSIERNPAPGVPTEVLLGACDGDVSDLQGQSYVDAARDLAPDPALRSAVLVEGANHNYFNEQWTPRLATDESTAKDDWLDIGTADDPACGGDQQARLTAEQQRTVGAVYVAAAAQALVQRRAAVVPLLDGSLVKAPSAGPARISAHALGGQRSPLLIPDGRTEPTTTGGVTAVRCDTTRQAGSPGGCGTAAMGAKTASFLPYTTLTGEPTRTALAVGWKAAGGQARVPVTGRALDAGATAVALRVIVPADAQRTSFAVALADTSGRRVELGVVTLDGIPPSATTVSGTHWAQEVRVPLDRAALTTAGLDPSRPGRLEIVPRSATGQLWLLDAWGWRPGLSAAPPVRLPRFDIGELRVDGGTGDHVVNVPVTITGTVPRPATVWIGYVDWTSPTIEVKEHSITVTPGMTRFDIPVLIHGAKIPTGVTAEYQIKSVALSGIVGGDAFVNLRVRGEGPAPQDPGDTPPGSVLEPDTDPAPETDPVPEQEHQPEQEHEPVESSR